MECTRFFSRVYSITRIARIYGTIWNNSGGCVADRTPGRRSRRGRERQVVHHRTVSQSRRERSHESPEEAPLTGQYWPRLRCRPDTRPHNLGPVAGPSVRRPSRGALVIGAPGQYCPLEASRPTIRSLGAGDPPSGRYRSGYPDRTVLRRRSMFQLLASYPVGLVVRYGRPSGDVPGSRRSSGPLGPPRRDTSLGRPVRPAVSEVAGNNARITDVPLLQVSGARGSAQRRRSGRYRPFEEVLGWGRGWGRRPQLSRTIRSIRSRPSSSRSRPFAKLIRM